jgi:hypothetical protein
MIEIMVTPKNTEHCVVCGSTIDYLRKAETLVCTYCGKKEPGHVKCPEGHFICNACHGKDAMRAVEDIAFTTDLKYPLGIAELMMSHPALPMLGCEHAYIAAGALLAALKNSWSKKITNEDIREAFERTAKQAHGGYCGLTGVCGIVPAVGACFSIFLGAKCGSDNEQKITMDAVAKVSQAIIGLTGPSCCKASVRASLSVAVNLFEEKFGIIFPAPKTAVFCKDSSRHPHGCRKEKCPYYKMPARDVLADAIHLPVTVCNT